MGAMLGCLEPKKADSASGRKRTPSDGHRDQQAKAGRHEPTAQDEAFKQQPDLSDVKADVMRAAEQAKAVSTSPAHLVLLEPSREAAATADADADGSSVLPSHPDSAGITESPKGPLGAANSNGTTGGIKMLGSSERHNSLCRLQQDLPVDVQTDVELTTLASGSRHIGFGPLKKENQDEFFQQVGGFGGRKNGCCYCIFDGHGTYGGRVAAFCRRQLPLLLERELRAYYETHLVDHPDEQTAIETIVSNSFVETERLLQESNVNCSCSGTTASVVFQEGNRLWVASAGDSRVVLLQQLPADEGGAWQALPLTIDHRPIRSSERKRVEAAGARVEPQKLPSGKTVGEPRLWLQDTPTPGLLISRSIGDDLATSIGCTARPELVHLTLRPYIDNFLVLASDGIWDVMDNERVCGLVTSTPEPQAACSSITEAALAEWEEKLAADNISVVVVRLVWGKSTIEDELALECPSTEACDTGSEQPGQREAVATPAAVVLEV